MSKKVEGLESVKEMILKGTSPIATRAEISAAKEYFDKLIIAHDRNSKDVGTIIKVFGEVIRSRYGWEDVFFESENKAIALLYCKEWIIESLGANYNHSVREKERQKEIEEMPTDLYVMSGGNFLKGFTINDAVEFVLKDIEERANFLKDVLNVIDKYKF